MEALLATAILLGSIIVLAELAAVGRHHVQSVEERSAAQLLCQSKMSELLTGISPLEEVQERALEADPDWVYTVEILPVRNLPLASLRVTVVQRQQELPNQTRLRQPKSFSLVRWIPDPDQGDSLGAENAEANLGP